MEEGVSPSLPQHGFPDVNHFVVSVSFSREHGFSGSFPVSFFVSGSFYGGSNFLHTSHTTPFSLVISIPFTRAHVTSGGNYRPVFRVAIGAGTLFHKWSDIDGGSTHSANRLETDMSGEVPSRNMGEGRSAASFLVRGLVGMAIVALRTDVVCAVLARASSDPGRCFVPVFMIPKSWVLESCFHSLLTPTPTTWSLGMLLSSYLGGGCFYGARQALACSGRQVTTFLGTGDPAQTTWGKIPKAWNPDLWFSHNSDHVLGSVKGGNGELGLGSQNGVKTSAGKTSSVDAKGAIVANRLEIALSGGDQSRTVGQLSSFFVEMALLLLRAYQVSAVLERASSVHDEFIIPELVLLKSWDPVPGLHSVPILTPMKGNMGLILSADPREGGLMSWVSELVIHSVPTPTPTMMTESLVMLPSGSDLAIRIRSKVFIGDWVSHGSARSLVTINSMMSAFR